jgi:hypothetical protein
VTQHGFNLFASYTRKPLENVIYTGAVFEICEQSLDGNARASENPGTADFLRDPFDRWAFAPIKHEKRLTDAMQGSKFVATIQRGRSRSSPDR